MRAETGIVDRDVEADEVFLVLSGEGTVHFADGSGPGARPGRARPAARRGRTQWHVTERLRKLYLT